DYHRTTFRLIALERRTVVQPEDCPLTNLLGATCYAARMLARSMVTRRLKPLGARQPLAILFCFSAKVESTRRQVLIDRAQGPSFLLSCVGSARNGRSRPLFVVTGNVLTYGESLTRALYFLI